MIVQRFLSEEDDSWTVREVKYPYTTLPDTYIFFPVSDDVGKASFSNCDIVLFHTPIGVDIALLYIMIELVSLLHRIG